MAKFKIEDALNLRAGKNFQIDSVDPSSTPGFDGDKDELDARFSKYDDELYELQERLFANGRAYGEDAPAALIVLQGMDTSGKGGAIRHVLTLLTRKGRRLSALVSPPRKNWSMTSSGASANMIRSQGRLWPSTARTMRTCLSSAYMSG